MPFEMGWQCRYPPHQHRCYPVSEYGCPVWTRSYHTYTVWV